MTNVVNRSPQNRRKRAARVERWNKAYAEGSEFKPCPVNSKSARYEWLRAIMVSHLASTTRLVCHTLAFHGCANGSEIYPTVRRIAAEARLSERAVCDHINLLVRRGWLWRKSRRGNEFGTGGFQYILCIPTKPDDGRAEGGSARVLNQAQHRNGEVLNVAQHVSQVLNAAQRRAEPDADGAERDSKMC